MTTHVVPEHKVVRTYCCSVCGKSLSSSVALTSHLKIHSGVKSFCCEYCGAMYSTKQNLMAHLIRIHDFETGTIKTCNICGKQFFRKSAYDTHYLIHSGKKPFHCHICNKYFRQKITKDLHLATHTGDYKYSCSKCDKKFLSAYKCKLHLQKHKDQICSLKTSMNGLNFGDNPQDETEVSVLLNKDKISDKLLNTEMIDSHILNHGKGITFFCSFPQCCDKSFSTETLLMKHISKSHVSKRSLSNKKISDEFENFRGSTVKPKCYCQICGKSFSNPFVQKRHSLIHSKDRPSSEDFSCKECSKSFKSSQGLEYHQKAHKGFYNYICEVCGKMFIRNSHFSSHMKLHSNIRSYNCILCSKSYKSNKNLKEHIKIKHSTT